MDYPGQLYYFINSIIRYLGDFANPVWQLLACVYVFILLYITYNRQPNYSRLNDFFFTLSIGLFVFILRAPTFTMPELNPDESQLMAGAATLIKYHVIWKDVEGTTVGMLSHLYLMLSNVLLGLKINYANVRLFSILFIFLPSIFFLYKAFLNLGTNKFYIRLGIIPLALFIGLNDYWDFVAYNGEFLPFLLISIMIFLLSKIFIRKISPYQYLTIGVLSAFLILAKIQTSPIVLGIFLALLITELYYNKSNKRQTVKSLAFYFSGFLSVWMVLFFYLLYHQNLNDFLNSYILSAFRYVSGGIDKIVRTDDPNANKVHDNLEIVMYLFTNIIKRGFTKVFLFLLINVLLVCSSAIFFFMNRKQLTESEKIPFVSLTIISIFSFITVFIPLRHYTHYLNFLVVPLCAVNFYFFKTVLPVLQQKFKNKFLSIFHTKVFYSILIFFISILFIINGNAGIKDLESKDYEPQIDPIVPVIQKLVKTNDRIVVWGWMNTLYIQSGCLQGTAAAQSEYLFYRNNEYHLNRFIKELRTNRPKLFVEATCDRAFNLRIRSESGYQTIKLVKDYIDSNYTYLGEFFKMRLFKLK